MSTLAGVMLVAIALLMSPTAVRAAEAPHAPVTQNYGADGSHQSSHHDENGALDALFEFEVEEDDAEDDIEADGARLGGPSLAVWMPPLVSVGTCISACHCGFHKSPTPDTHGARAPPAL